MTEPEADPLSELTDGLKDALEKQDWHRVSKIGIQFVGWLVAAKIEREDHNHNEIVAELAGIREALELQALAAIHSSTVMLLNLPPRGIDIHDRILARQACKPSGPTSDSCIGEETK